jgi:phosphatidate cytidylyltransferase
MNRVLIRVIGAPLILAGLALCVYADYVRQTTTAIRVLMACFAAISFHELCAMGRLKGLRPSEGLGLVAILASWAYMIGALGAYGYGHFVFIALGPLFVIAVLLLLVINHRSFGPVDAGFTVLGVVYISLLLFVPVDNATWSHVSQWIPAWNTWLLFLVATNKGSDMAAYGAGKLMGRHKMAPTISPNKTWEGAAAGLIAGTTLGVLCLRSWPYEWWWDFPRPPESLGFQILIAACVTVAAQLGDLVKSAIKRWAGVKDSGRFLPEFGGALDMIDSFIVSAPVAYLLLRFFHLSR